MSQFFASGGQSIGVSAREFQKSIYFCFIEHTKAFDYVDHNQLWTQCRGSDSLLCFSLPPTLGSWKRKTLVAVIVLRIEGSWQLTREDWSQLLVGMRLADLWRQEAELCIYVYMHISY